MINKFYGIGNLGSDPEIRYLDNGTPVATFSIACTEKWKDQSGQQQETTEWVNCVAWKRLAEICGEYLAKGSRVFIEGKLQTRCWDKDGVKHYKTEVILREMKILSQRNESGGSSSGHGGYYAPPMGDDVPF